LPARPPAESAPALAGSRRERGYAWPEERVRASPPLVQEKIEKLSQYPGRAGFFFEPVSPDGADPETCRAAYAALEPVDPWEASRIEDALRAFAERLGQKPRQAFAPVRLAVTRSHRSPRPLP